MNHLPHGTRGLGLTLTTDNGTQFTSTRYVETLNRFGIQHRRTAYNHPEGNSYIERFHRSLKEEEVWINDTRASITHGSPSPCGSRNIITTVRTADSTAEPARIRCLVPSQNTYFKPGLARLNQQGAGCTTLGIIIAESMALWKASCRTCLTMQLRRRTISAERSCCITIGRSRIT